MGKRISDSAPLRSAEGEQVGGANRSRASRRSIAASPRFLHALWTHVTASVSTDVPTTLSESLVDALLDADLDGVPLWSSMPGPVALDHRLA